MNVSTFRAPRPPGGNARHSDADILAFIRDHIAANGYSPSIRDIGRACGISSTAVVEYHLVGLELGGHITREPELARSIRLTDPGDCVCHCGHRHRAAEAVELAEAAG